MPINVRPAAPKDDRSILAVPKLSDWRSNLAENVRHLHGNASIAGRTLSELRTQARQDLVDAARTYHATFDGDTSWSPDIDQPFIVTGHQPELFHPGVWIKSFATARFAKGVSGLPVHVIIDNDTIKASAIRVPAGGPDRFIVGHVPFDKWEGEIPYEERAVVDESVLADFPARVRATMSRLPFEPIVSEYWEHVLEAANVTSNLGERLAFGRRKLEQQFGIQNVEVPLSHLCRSRSFLLLIGEVITRLADFQSIYNTSLAEYRQKYKVRSRHHPATDLDKDNDWRETPFWIWHPNDVHRSVLWVRQNGPMLELRADEIWVASLPVGSEPSADEIANYLSHSIGDWKIRPRAMMTTLYLRVLVSDWFIHGLGGGKYDEVTDQIARGFWKIEPPSFAILTATLRLPAPSKGSVAYHLAECRKLARDMYWNPDRHLDDQLRERAPVAGWIEEAAQRRAVTPSNHADRYERFLALRALNTRLRPYVEADRRQIEEQGSDLADRLRSDQALESRDYAFCLHPRESLAELMSQIPDFSTL